MNFRDNYGQELGREGAWCQSTNSINVVMKDSCPCHKPGNEYSNTRWCCGDMDHLDVGIWAFRCACVCVREVALEYSELSLRALSSAGAPSYDPLTLNPNP
jgi:hypothetical protein